MPTSRSIHRRRRAAVIGAAVLVLAIGVYLPLTLLAPLADAHESVPAVAIATGTAPAISWPQFGSSAFGTVGNDGPMEAGGSGAALPIASISKIVTALVTLQAKPLAVGDDGPSITFSAADHGLYAKYVALDGSVKPMPAGATMSERQMLQVALIASANNYAEAIADWAFGSESAFVTTATAWLKAHGLDHTTLVEPSGIDPANTSTASDLVVLGRLALANPVLASIVDTPSITLPVVGTIHDGNALLGHDGVIGIKTGTLVDTSSLLFAADYRLGGKTIRIVGAVLGAPDRSDLYPAARSLLKQIEGGFREVTLSEKGQIFAEYSTPWDRGAPAVATASRSAVVWSGTPVKAVVTATHLRSGAKGERVGTVSFTTGSSTVRVALLLDRPLTDPGPLWRLGHPLAAAGIG